MFITAVSAPCGRLRLRLSVQHGRYTQPRGGAPLSDLTSDASVTQNRGKT